jgi:ankyrin repeat protein
MISMRIISLLLLISVSPTVFAAWTGRITITDTDGKRIPYILGLAQLNKIDRIQEMIDDGDVSPEEINTVDSAGNSTLFYLVSNGRADLLQPLIALNANVNQLNPYTKKTALDQAAKQNRADLLELLTPSASVPTMTQALNTAVEEKSEQAATYLRSRLRRFPTTAFQSKPAPQSKKSSLLLNQLQESATNGSLASLIFEIKDDGNALDALSYAVCHGDRDAIDFILDDPAATQALINKPDRLGNNALYWAFIYEHIDIARKLLLKGTDLNQRNNDGVTPFHAAASLNKHTLINELLPSAKSETILSAYSDLDKLIGDDEKVDDNLRRILHDRLGVLINQKDQKGFTIVDEHVIVGKVETLKLLLPFATAETVIKSNNLPNLKPNRQVKKLLQKRLAECSNEKDHQPNVFTAADKISIAETKEKLRDGLTKTLLARGIDVKRPEVQFEAAAYGNKIEELKRLLPLVSVETVKRAIGLAQAGRKVAQESLPPRYSSDFNAEEFLTKHLKSLPAQQPNDEVYHAQPVSEIELKKQSFRKKLEQDLIGLGNDISSVESRFGIACTLHEMPAIKELLPQINSKVVIEQAINNARDSRDIFKKSDEVEILLRKHVESMERQDKAARDKEELGRLIKKFEGQRPKVSAAPQQAKPAIQKSADVTPASDAPKSTKKKKKKKKAEEGDQSESTPQEQNNQQANAAPADPAEKQPTSSTTSSFKLQAVSYTLALGDDSQKKKNDEDELEALKKELLKDRPEISLKQLIFLQSLKESFNRPLRRGLHRAALLLAKSSPTPTPAGSVAAAGPISHGAANNESEQSVQKPSKPKPSKLERARITLTPYNLPKELFPPQSQKELTRSEREDMDFCRQFDLSTRPLPELSSSSDSDDGKEPEEPANMSIQHLEELQREQQKWVSYKTAAGEYRLDTEKLIDGTEDRKGGHFRGPNDERELLYESPHGSIVRRNVNGKEGITTCFAPGISPEEIIQEVIPTALDRGEIRSFKEQPGGIVVVGLRQEAHKPGQDPRYPQDIEAVIDSKNGKVLTLRPDLPLRRLK